MAIFARSPKTRIFCKRAKGGPSKIFKNRPKNSPRLKGPKAHSRKRHYPLICTHLKCKHCRQFWRKQQLQTSPNGQVMAIFTRSFKTRIFWKSAKRGPREIFQKSSKKKTSFERQKSTLAQIVLCCTYYALKILALPNPEFKILADFKILAFQNREFKILALQKPEFKILAHLKISNILNLRFWPISRF